MFRTLTRPSLVLSLAATLLLSSLASTSVASGCGQLAFSHHGHAQFFSHHNYANVVYPVLSYPKFVAVEADPYNVQLVGSAMRHERNAKQAAETVTNLNAEIQSLRGELAALREAISGSAGPAKPAPPAAKPAPAPAPAPAPPTTSPPPTTPAPTPSPEPGGGDEPIQPAQDQLTKWVWDKFQATCANCHSGSMAKANFQLFEEDKVTKVPLTVAKLQLIDQVLYSNEMPKAPVPKWNAQEYDTWRGWMQLQTKAIREVARHSAKR